MGLGVRYMNLSTDGHVATVVWLAGIGARKNGVNGAAVGQRGNARGGYEAVGREHIVALMFPDAGGFINIVCTFVHLFAWAPTAKNF